MNEISYNESKEIQKNILKEVHNYCSEHNLYYFLMFGTLIGAVRHKGFIPWDDDIDICMPREDYDEFFRSFGRRKNLEAISCETTPNYYLPFGKVINNNTVLIENVCDTFKIGVYIDIFPLDSVYKDEKKNKRLLKRILFLRNLLCLKILPGSKKRHGWKRFAHSILSKFSFMLNMNTISRKINALLRNIPKNLEEKTYCISANIDEKGCKRRYPKEFFKERVLMKFEGEKFWAPQGYDGLLHYIYGDYMQLPPVEERITHHEYQQYWKE